MYFIKFKSLRSVSFLQNAVIWTDHVFLQSPRVLASFLFSLLELMIKESFDYKTLSDFGFIVPAQLVLTNLTSDKIL